MQTYPNHACFVICDHGRWCEFPINLSALFPTDKRRHENTALAKGVNADCCNRAATIRLDDKDYCRDHAGEVLLGAALDAMRST